VANSTSATLATTRLDCKYNGRVFFTFFYRFLLSVARQRLVLPIVIFRIASARLSPARLRASHYFASLVFWPKMQTDFCATLLDPWRVVCVAMRWHRVP
jgi:hypothetical protein